MKNLIKNLFFYWCCASFTTVVFASVIHLNTADLSTLMTLKGIGKHKAENILSYRKQHGKFTKISQFKEVAGIGKHILELNKDKFILN